MVAPPAFVFAGPPRVVFGPGKIQELPEYLRRFGRKVLLVTGARSLEASTAWRRLRSGFERHGFRLSILRVEQEPSPLLVDQAVNRFRGQGLEAVAAIGGGSVLDAGKAISAMLPVDGSVAEYLEGAADARPHPGLKVPFLAAPTTAGTGTEATKNASLRMLGPGGYKRSLRHDHFIPDVALIDPELTLTCPRKVTAACGLDALAQLLEAYVSPAASPVTDALAWSGLEQIRDSLLRVCGNGANDLPARSAMAYAALASGLALANAGLGVVHSLSSVLGGRLDIPHGVICGTLLGPGTRINVEKILSDPETHAVALRKHARLGALFAGRESKDPAEGCTRLVETLEQWTRSLGLPGLGDYGLSPAEADAVAAATGVRNNPVQLSRQEIRSILLARLASPGP